MKFPRMANVDNMWNRTGIFFLLVSIFSGGKLFSATGSRVGWAIGPQ